MNSFDNLIMDALVNVDSMLKARRKILKGKLDAGHSVREEYHRAKRFQDRYATFVRDWQYWYYDGIAGSGDTNDLSKGRLQRGTEVQKALPRPVGQRDRAMPRKKAE